MSPRNRGIVLLGFCLLTAVSVWLLTQREEQNATRILQQSQELFSRKQYVEAEQFASKAFELDPLLHRAAIVAAHSAAGQDEFVRAVSYLQKIEDADPALAAEAHFLEAKISHRKLYRFSVAEAAYRKVLSIHPEQFEAHLGVAKLLVQCGRHRESIPHILQIIQQDEFTDLLYELGMPGAGIVEDGSLELARRAEPHNPYPLVGLALLAEKAEDHAEAIDLLQQAIRIDSDCFSAQAALGKLLLLHRSLDEVQRWLNDLPQSTWDYAEPWIAMGDLAEREHNTEGAIRCYWEAAVRSPETKSPFFRVAQLLTQTNQSALAAPFAEHLSKLQELETLQVHFEATPDYYLTLAKLFQSVGRIWEAYAWSSLACRERGSPEDLSLFEEMKKQVASLPLEQTVHTVNPAHNVDLSHFTKPILRHLEVSPSPLVEAESRLTFQNVADDAGLRYSFFNGTSGPPTHRVYELTGGGIGVIDYDLDGDSDVCFSQGIEMSSLSTEASRRMGDRLFRNSSGTSFKDVSELAGIRESDFGQGVTVGDFNTDGFPDLYVASLGTNRLWKNNGDGTFIDFTTDSGLSSEHWTTSCVMVDLNGDTLPDLFDVNYMQGPDLLEKICYHPDGSPYMCMPFRFDIAPDQLWINDGRGQFVSDPSSMLEDNRDGKGLGILAWDPQEEGNISLLIANDVTPNNFLVPEFGDDGKVSFHDRGLISGLACNRLGENEGSMGIALGDANEDGSLDLFVTNFHNETNTLYTHEADALYLDRTESVGLAAPSIPFVGFGTQFIDVDLDGRQELFISNGDIENRNAQEIEHQMRPQLFKRDKAGFIELRNSTLGTYFAERWVGRAVARLDWNHDGRTDLLVGHLEAPYALLQNSTSEVGSYLAIKLVGVQSNRDAIGTTIRAKIDERVFVHQLVAGDGYQSSNERQIIIGTGTVEVVDELVIHWPSGSEQKFERVPVPQRATLVEGRQLVNVP